MPAEVNCEHCGASVVVPQGDAAGVACPYCEQWMVLRRAKVATPRLAPPSPRSSGRVWMVIVPLVVLAALAVVVVRRTAPAPASTSSSMPAQTSVPPIASPSSSVAAKPGYFRALETFGAHGGLPGQMLDARHVAVDGAGNVWVADRESPRVQKLDAHGRFLLQVNRDEKDLPVVVGLAADAKGNVFLSSDEARGPIVVLSGDDGHVIRKIVQPLPDERWYDLAVDQTGVLYALTEDTGSQYSVLKMDVTGKVLARTEKTKKDDLATGRPAIDGEGHIYVLHRYERKIYVHDAKGAIVNRFGAMGHGDGDFDLGVQGLVWDFHGHVLVANDGVQVFDADGRYLARSAASEAKAPFDLALAPDGTLYVLNGDDTIQRYALDPNALGK
jgi:DNA-binding beta-propeller fold protein YncE